MSSASPMVCIEANICKGRFQMPDNPLHPASTRIYVRGLSVGVN